MHDYIINIQWETLLCDSHQLLQENSFGTASFGPFHGQNHHFSTDGSDLPLTGCLN